MSARADRWRVFAMVPLLALAAPAAAERVLSLDDYESFDSAQSVGISPDGRTVSYVLDGRIYVTSAGDDEPRPLTSNESSAWAARWAADGESIFFLSDRGESTQLFKLSVTEPGEATQVTQFENGVASINLSPDESRILLQISDNQLKPKEEDDEPQPFVINRRHFKRDAGDGYIVDGENEHLYVYEIEEQTLSQLTTGSYEEDSAAWSPDGQSVVFVSNREEDPDIGYRTDLWLVSAAGDDSDASLVRLTNDDRPKYSPAFSPDGEEIAFLTAANGVYGNYHVAVVPVSGGEPRILTTELDRWAGPFMYSSDGKWIYFSYYESGARLLARVRVSDAKIETLVSGDITVHSFDVADSGAVVLTASEANTPSNVYRVRRGELSRVTDLNRELLDELKLGAKTRHSFENDEGIRIDTFIVTPPDYEPGRAYPAILNIHGGPQGQFAWGFSFAAQYYASKGYVVVEPNPRGSIGRSEEFLSAIYRLWGVPDFHDVMGAVDYAIEEGFADPDKLAVTGFSYGGYMTNVAITETDRFKAAASGAGHSLIEANVGHDIYQRWYFWELGPPWENRDRYDVHSPLLRAGNVTTPTIFLGGRIDWNVPILNAELFYQALKFKGVDTQLIVYPDAHHGGWPTSFEKDYLTRVADWFEQYVGD